MNPMLISNAWAAEAGTAQDKLTLSARASNTVDHQIELVVSMSAAIKKARRCGAANSQMGRQGDATDWLVAGRVDSLTELGLCGLAVMVDYCPLSMGRKAG